MVLDRIDKKILNTLQENGKITNSKLSKIVGISAPATLERVKRLELAGVITHFTAVVNPEKIRAFHHRHGEHQPELEQFVIRGLDQGKNSWIWMR